jgi:hypothetical protein
MIYKLDHIGITVPSLSEAQRDLEAFHPCLHTQLGMESKEALREVSVHQPEQFHISLHRTPNSIGIELIEYPRMAEPADSIFPWYYTTESRQSQLPAIRATVGSRSRRWREEGRFAEIVSQLAVRRVFNALVLTVEDLEVNERFWTDLRFRRIHADQDLLILMLTSPLPPHESSFILLFRVESVAPCYTDAEGINEIALLCASCSASLDACNRDIFRSSVSTFSVGGKEIELCYLRSPSGVLTELYSVRNPARER